MYGPNFHDINQTTQPSLLLLQGFQGTSLANSGYATSASSYYPSYGAAPGYPTAFQSSAYPQTAAYASAPAGAMAGYPGNYAPASAYATYSPYSQIPGSVQVAQASSPYQTYATGQSGSPDFSAVLDSFVRGAGLSPHGAHDQEAAASNLQAKGDTPVFSFKKLYSFPFYLSSENPTNEGFNLQIPYLKRHIRRMSPGFQENQKHAQSLAHQQQLLRAVSTQTDYLNNYIQQLLRERAEREADNSAQQALQDYRRKAIAERLAERQRDAYERQQVARDDLHQRQAARLQYNQANSFDSVSDQSGGDSGEDVAETQYQPKFAALYNQLQLRGGQQPTISARSDVVGPTTAIGAEHQPQHGHPNQSSSSATSSGVGQQ